MKLAELLVERASLQNSIKELADRLCRFAVVQEGDQLPFNPEHLLAKLDRSHTKLEKIIKTINQVNSSTQFEPGVSLADAIVTRDILKSRRSILGSLEKACSTVDNRYSKKEIKYVPSIDVEQTIDIADELSKNLRLLDARIQKMNWEIEVTLEA